MPAASRRWGPGERTLVSCSSTGLLPKGWVFSATAIANGQKVTEKIPKKSEKSDEERGRSAPCPKRTGKERKRKCPKRTGAGRLGNKVRPARIRQARGKTGERKGTLCFNLICRRAFECRFSQAQKGRSRSVMLRARSGQEKKVQSPFFSSSPSVRPAPNCGRSLVETTMLRWSHHCTLPT